VNKEQWRGLAIAAVIGAVAEGAVLSGLSIPDGIGLRALAALGIACLVSIVAAAVAVLSVRHSAGVSASHVELKEVLQ
jgi:hypothetical protein